MDKTIKPSPRPWKQSCFLITSANGDWVTHTGLGNLPPSRSHESEANAEHIVRCVNNFDALVEAATDALEDITGPITHSGIKIRYSTRDKLTAALKVAQEEK